MVAFLYLVHYVKLLQNATDIITKYDSFVTKCVSYYKIRRSLQNALVHTAITLLANFEQCQCFYPQHQVYLKY